MNKQQIIEKLNSELYNSPWNEYQNEYNRAIEDILLFIVNLDNEQTEKHHLTPPHYQGTTQPIDLINAQNLNFNLGNVVKYVCRAGKKQGENTLSDLEKAQNYLYYEIERVENNE